MNCKCNFSWATPEQNKEIEDYVDNLFTQEAHMLDEWIEQELIPSLMTIEDKIVFGDKTIRNIKYETFDEPWTWD